MPFELGERARAAGYRLHSFDTIGSTSTEALERARAGDPGRLWFAADEQTAGRGRRGRAWATPKGNLGASLLLVLDAPAMRQAATLGFVAGLALHGALERLAPAAEVAVALDGGGGIHGQLRFELKWPNDVIARGAKLAGIMLESERLAGDRFAVVIGIGVNVAEAPGEMPYAVTSLADLGVLADASAVFRELSEAWVEHETLWNMGLGMGQIRRQWLAHGAGLGRPIAVKAGRRVVRGTFETIDEAGRLVVRLPDGASEAIAAAEVHFGAAASLPAGGS